MLPRRKSVIDPTEPPVDDDADASARRALTAALASHKPSTPAQRALQRLVKKIELAREELKSWELYAPHHQQRVATELGPLREQLRARQRKMVVAIDEILSGPRGRGHAMRRAHRALLRELLVGFVKMLRQDGGQSGVQGGVQGGGHGGGQRRGPDEELDAVLARHAPEQRAEELALAQSYIRDVLGLGAGTGVQGAASAEELYNRAARQLDEQQALSAPAARRGMPSRDQLAREKAQKEADETLRDAHRTLLSRRHPQRPVAKARKDPLLKRVNGAYKAHDLLTLLGQLVELGQLDVQQLCSAPRVERYKAGLQQQYSALQAKLREVWEFYAPLVGRDLSELTVQGVDRQLTLEIRGLHRTLQELASDLAQIKDPKGRRALLDRLGWQQEQRMQTALLITVDTLGALHGHSEGRKPSRKR